MPNARGDVGAHVGIELGFLDEIVGLAVTEVEVVPTPVGALDISQPLIRPFGLNVEPGNVKSHRAFDVVPRIAMAAVEPRDHPAGGL